MRNQVNSIETKGGMKGFVLVLNLISLYISEMSFWCDVVLLV